MNFPTTTTTIHCQQEDSLLKKNKIDPSSLSPPSLLQQPQQPRRSRLQSGTIDDSKKEDMDRASLNSILKITQSHVPHVLFNSSAPLNVSFYTHVISFPFADTSCLPLKGSFPSPSFSSHALLPEFVLPNPLSSTDPDSDPDPDPNPNPNPNPNLLSSTSLPSITTFNKHSSFPCPSTPSIPSSSSLSSSSHSLSSLNSCASSLPPLAPSYYLPKSLPFPLLPSFLLSSTSSTNPSYIPTPIGFPKTTLSTTNLPSSSSFFSSSSSLSSSSLSELSSPAPFSTTTQTMVNCYSDSSFNGEKKNRQKKRLELDGSHAELTVPTSLFSHAHNQRVSTSFQGSFVQSAAPHSTSCAISSPSNSSSAICLASSPPPMSTFISSSSSLSSLSSTSSFACSLPLVACCQHAFLHSSQEDHNEKSQQELASHSTSNSFSLFSGPTLFTTASFISSSLDTPSMKKTTTLPISPPPLPELSSFPLKLNQVNSTPPLPQTHLATPRSCIPKVNSSSLSFKSSTSLTCSTTPSSSSSSSSPCSYISSTHSSPSLLDPFSSLSPAFIPLSPPPHPPPPNLFASSISLAPILNTQPLTISLSSPLKAQPPSPSVHSVQFHPLSNPDPTLSSSPAFSDFHPLFSTSLQLLPPRSLDSLTSLPSTWSCASSTASTHSSPCSSSFSSSLTPRGLFSSSNHASPLAKQELKQIDPFYDSTCSCIDTFYTENTSSTHPAFFDSKMDASLSHCIQTLVLSNHPTSSNTTPPTRVETVPMVKNSSLIFSSAMIHPPSQPSYLCTAASPRCSSSTTSTYHLSPLPLVSPKNYSSHPTRSTTPLSVSSCSPSPCHRFDSPPTLFLLDTSPQPSASFFLPPLPSVPPLHSFSSAPSSPLSSLPSHACCSSLPFSLLQLSNPSLLSTSSTSNTVPPPTLSITSISAAFLSMVPCFEFNLSYLPSLSLLQTWLNARFHLLHYLGSSTSLSILGGPSQKESYFGFQPYAIGTVGSSSNCASSNSIISSHRGPITYPTPPSSFPSFSSRSHRVSLNRCGLEPHSVLIEQIDLGVDSFELHVPTMASAPNHLLSWTTVYAANQMNIYQLSPLQSHVLPLLVRPLVNYSEKVINKEKMPHLIVGIGGAGSGKCHAKDTPILMFNGLIQWVQHIQVGDVLMGDDSMPRTVLSLARGIDDMFAIELGHGERYIVNQDHILCLRPKLQFLYYSSKQIQLRYLELKSEQWLTHTFSSLQQAAVGLEEWMNNDETIIEINVKTFLSLPKALINNLYGYRKSAEFPFQPVPWDPYLLGYVLGILYRYDLQKLSTSFSLYSKVLKKVLYHFLSAIQKKMVWFWPFFHFPYSLLEFLSKKNLLQSPHIPLMYKCNTHRVRSSFLAGLLDSSGTLYSKKPGFQLQFFSPTFVADVLYVARSLGLVAYVRKQKKNRKMNRSMDNPSLKPEHLFTRIWITGPNLCFLPFLVHSISNLFTSPCPVSLSTPLTKIKIKKLGKGEYFGFTLDGNHRYLLGDFSVTHNTWSYLLGCIDYIVRGTHFQRGVIKSSSLGGPKAILILPSVAAVLRLQSVMTQFSKLISQIWAKTQHAHSSFQYGFNLLSFFTLIQSAPHIPIHFYDIILTTPSFLTEAVKHHSLNFSFLKYFIIDEIDQLTDSQGLVTFADHLNSLVMHLPLAKDHTLKIALYSRSQSSHLDFLIKSLCSSLSSLGLLQTAFHDAYLRITVFPLCFQQEHSTSVPSHASYSCPSPKDVSFTCSFPSPGRLALSTSRFSTYSTVTLLHESFYLPFVHYLFFYLKKIRHSFLALSPPGKLLHVIERLIFSFQGPNRLLFLVTSKHTRAKQLASQFKAFYLGHTTLPAVIASFAIVVMTSSQFSMVPSIARWFEHRNIIIMSEWVPSNVQEYYQLVFTFLLPSVSLCVDGCVKLSFSGKAIIPIAFFTLYEHPKEQLKIHEIKLGLTSLPTAKPL